MSKKNGKVLIIFLYNYKNNLYRNVMIPGKNAHIIVKSIHKSFHLESRILTRENIFT